MAIQPSADLALLVGRVVVKDGVHGVVLRKLGLDGVRKADELLMAVTLHVAPDHRAVEDVERREQRRGAIALVILGHSRATPTLERHAGLGAVEYLDLLFSFTDSPAASWRTPCRSRA